MEGLATWVEIIAFVGALVVAIMVIRAYYSRKPTEELARGAEIGTFVVALIAFALAIRAYYSDEAGRRQQTYSSAWIVVNSPGQPSVDGGRKRALEYLSYEKQSLQGAELSNALLSFIALNGMDLNRVNMRNADLFGADLRAASLWEGHMEQASFQFARMQGVDLERANLDCADLRGAHLGTLSLSVYLNEISDKIFGINNIVGGALERLKTIRGSVRNEYVTGKIEPEAESWGFKFNGLKINNRVVTVLVDAYLQYAHLEGADLNNANLTHAHLTHAYLGEYKDRFDPDQEATYRDDLNREGNHGYINVQFQGNTPSDPNVRLQENIPPDRNVHCWRNSYGLKGLYIDRPKEWKPTTREICEWFDKHPDYWTNYKLEAPFCLHSQPASDTTPTRANLTDACLMGADLTGADLTGADLTGADLTGADLTGADLTRTILTGTNVTRNQIANARVSGTTVLPEPMTEISGTKVRGSPNCHEPAPEGQENTSSRGGASKSG